MLIPCPDCGHQVSIRASTCPSCGAPVTVPTIGEAIGRPAEAARDNGHVTIELTSKALKLRLILTGTAFLFCFLGMVASVADPDMSTKNWFIATAITFGLYMLARLARWWHHG